MAVNMSPPVAAVPANAANGLPPIPFRKATLRKQTLMGSENLSAGLGNTFNIELDSKGYMGAVYLDFQGQVVVSTGDAGAIADYPWALIKRVEIRDSSGGLLISLTGYQAWLAGMLFHPNLGRNEALISDARVYNVSVASAATVDFRLVVPLHIETGTRDNLGLVPNQNASFKYTLRVEIDTEANIVATPANTAWALTMQPAYQYYTVPNPVRADGRQQQTVPPFAGVVRQQIGRTLDVIGNNEHRLNMIVGRVYRGFILVTRDGGVRENGLSRLRLKFGDDNLLFDMLEQDIIMRAYELYGAAPPTGVYPVIFTADTDSFVGSDGRRDLLDTRRLAQLYFEATTTGDIDQIDIIEDVLIVPQSMSL